MGPGGHEYGGVFSTFTKLVRTEGIGSLYVGLLPAIISMAPAGAVFYGVYDVLKASPSNSVYVYCHGSLAAGQTDSKADTTVLFKAIACFMRQLFSHI